MADFIYLKSQYYYGPGTYNSIPFTLLMIYCTATINISVTIVSLVKLQPFIVCYITSTTSVNLIIVVPPPLY